MMFTRSYQADALVSQFLYRCRGFEIGLIIELISIMGFWILLWVKLGCVAAQRTSSETGGPYEDSLGQA